MPQLLCISVTAAPLRQRDDGVLKKSARWLNRLVGQMQLAGEEGRPARVALKVSEERITL